MLSAHALFNIFKTFFNINVDMYVQKTLWLTCVCHLPETKHTNTTRGMSVPDGRLLSATVSKQNNFLLKSNFTFFCMGWVFDYLEVTFKLSSKDLLSGRSQKCGYVAEILLLPIHCTFKSCYRPPILRMGHLDSVVIQKYRFGILTMLQFAKAYTSYFFWTWSVSLLDLNIELH